MAERPPRGRPVRARLSRDRVLAAAIALADEGGIESLSMRKLGQALGVEAMSLYNHVAGKDDLLDGITDAVLGEIELPEGGDWKADLRRHALSSHEVLASHPWACNLAMSPERDLPVAVRRTDWMLGRLRGAGFSPELTYHGYHALDSHILGFTLWETGHALPGNVELAQLVERFFEAYPPDEYPHLHEHAQQHLAGFGRGEEGAFELVLDLILDGLERMRGRDPREPTRG